MQTAKWRRLLLAGLVLLTACGQPSKESTDTVSKQNTAAVVSPEVTRLFGGNAAITLLRQAEQVAAYRLVDRSYFQDTVDKYHVAKGPIKVAASVKDDLLKTLLDKGTYLWEQSKGCEPDYGVRLQFARDKHSIDILICFKCETLTVYTNGKAGSGEDFDGGSAQLAAIAKALFPADDAIQSLQ